MLKVLIVSGIISIFLTFYLNSTLPTESVYGFDNSDLHIQTFGFQNDNTILNGQRPDTTINNSTLPDYNWTSMISLGGQFVGLPAIGKNADGRLEVFAVGTDKALWHKWQKTPGSQFWSESVSLGAPSASGIRSIPAVAENTDGRLEVFATDSGRSLWYKWQNTPGSQSWSDWVSLGMYVQHGPVVSKNGDGRIEIFVSGPDKALYHKWQLSAGSHSWSNWEPLGGIIKDVFGVGENADGRLEVFVQGADDALWHRWQLSAGSHSWSNWESLGGKIIPAYLWKPHGGHSVGQNVDGRLEIFISSKENGNAHISQRTPGGPYGDWSFMPGGCCESTPSVGRHSDGRLDVFLTAYQSGILHKWQTAPDGTSWSPGWIPMSADRTFSNIVSKQNQDGRLEIFWIGENKALWHIWEKTPKSPKDYCLPRC